MENREAEIALVAKLSEMRQDNSYTYEKLATLMEAEGVKLHPSAIQKTEKGGRRLSIDELLCLSRVYGVPVVNLISQDQSEFQEKLRQDGIAIRELATELSKTIHSYAATYGANDER